MDSDLKDIYTVGLMNYCDGDKNSTGGYKVTYCSERKAAFWFNPVDVWGLNNTAAEGMSENRNLPPRRMTDKNRFDSR